MLDLRWRVLCPYCRGGPPGVTRLSDLRASVHCETCNIRFDANFDRSVEVCFSPAPAIRPIEAQTYCIGGPGLSPHAVAQWVLPPNERRETALDLSAGDYALTSLQSDAPRSLRVCEEGAPQARIRLRQGEKQAQIALEEAQEEIACRAAWTLAN